MKVKSIQSVVESTVSRLSERRVKSLQNELRSKRPPDLVTPDRLALRRAHLVRSDNRPSPIDLERILGTNDLVDINYLARAQRAARSVCRIVLRERAGREIGYGTGFKVAPSVLITNHHVLPQAEDAKTAAAEFGYELDMAGVPSPTTRFALEPDRLFIGDRSLDFALVGISSTPAAGPGSLAEYGFLRFIREIGKINRGEFVTIIQHPSGQPKQIALRENQLLSIEELVLWYQSDTAPGSSGSPVFNDSWEVVALHHSGVPRKDKKGNWLLKNGQPAGPDADDGDIEWLANEGIRVSRIVRFVEENATANAATDEFLLAAHGELVPEALRTDGSWQPARTAMHSSDVEPISGGVRVTVPVSLLVSVEGAGPTSRRIPEPRIASPSAAEEKLKFPIVDTQYESRRGYDPNFLARKVPLPAVKNTGIVAKTDSGEHVLPYEHFSVVMHKRRRLALFVASNVDARPQRKEPEPNRDYSRKGLGGFGPNDREMWLTDPRVPEEHQLPDRFYTKDGGAFDKGHLVRREDVCWGASYAEVRRANGDTYHTTNCSPQVADFNQASKGGIWGKLENVILEQAKADRYCVMAGPLLRTTDRDFVGTDHRGEVRVQIPSAYWKIVVARSGTMLQSFAFLLEQDLADVPLEFAVKAPWRDQMIAIAELEKLVREVTFPKEVRDSDQFDLPAGEALMSNPVVQGLERRRRG